MTENSKYFVLKKKAVPEVLLKVVEAKRLLDCNPGMTVQEAADQLGISRSSFYKYKEDIFPFHDEAKGKTVTFMLQVEDEPGLLSTVSEHHCRIWSKHSYNSSDDPDQRNRYADPQRSGAFYHRGRICHDRKD